MTNNKKLSDLNFDTKNANKHTAKGQKALEDSLQKYGAGRSILVDKNNNIIAGNLTAEVFGQIGLEEVQIVESDGKKLIVVKRTDIDINSKAGRELAISDNRASELSLNWDSDALKDIQENFKVDLSEFFSNNELKLLGLDSINLNEDNFEIPNEIITDIVLGDLFEIGEHRLLCGDSTDSDQVAKLMDGQKAEISFTSPPYNAGTTPTEVKMGKSSKYANDNDNKSEDEYLKLLTDFSNNTLLFSQYSFVNIQSLSGNKIALIDYLYNMKSFYADTLIWQKGNAQPAMANNVLNSQFEYVHCFSEKANRAIGTKDFRGTISNVIEISKQTKNKIKEHNATFPVDFANFFVSNFCNNSVLDLFCGSGTTMVVAHQLNRKCYGMEIDPKYCQVILDRMLKFDPSLKIIKNGKHS